LGQMGQCHASLQQPCREQNLYGAWGS
jgi:hypothetical protein